MTTRWLEPECIGNMSKEEFTGGAVCRQRFKGIENFLRRVAFNLGNTPSQTEVKIISCIPIDVTDLQQKIIHLERQLNEARCKPAIPSSTSSPPPPTCRPPKPSKLCPLKRTSVNTALYDTTFPAVSCAAISCKSLDCDQSTSPTCISSKRKSNVSFLFPDIEVNEYPQIDSNDNSNTSQVTEEKVNVMETPVIYDSPKISDPRPNENLRNFFKKKKKLVRGKKGRSPCVYYAQTDNSSPFNKSDLPEEQIMPKKENNLMTRSYLTNMINKQYKPQLLGDDISAISQFSSPVCRDIPQPHCEGVRQYESDICSCCHGPFHNIDSHINKYSNPQTYMLNEMNTGSAYYDTNQYDLVPVKEKPIKIKKDFEMSRKKDPKPQIDMKCWPENVRTKYRYHSLYPPPVTHYRTPHLRTEYIIRDRDDNYVRKIPIKLNRVEPLAKKVPKRRREKHKIDRPINIETSKSCSIDFGNVYPKVVYENPKIQKSLEPIPVLRKNAECLTTAINNSECQTITSNVEANASDAKTEATLNQIKSILQSVLAEVKVSSQTKSQISEHKPKKDAVVQKGVSQSNMQPSSLMNSITYSPYTMSPNPYMASCSRQLNSNQFFYPQSAMKCFQNFPLFLQNPGRHICTSCYRNSSQVKSGYTKQATTTATNTDSVKEERSKETEKLIKEIYKSMALTMEIPNKDTSLSEYEDIMKSMQHFTSPIIVKNQPKKQPKKIRSVVQAVSELFMKKDIIETSDTQNTTFESKEPSKETSMPSQLVTTDTEAKLRNDRLEKYLRIRNTETSVDEPNKRACREAMIHTATTITESETSSNEGLSNTSLVLPKEVHSPKQKKEKQGLFSKMFKSVKLFKPRERVKKKEVKTESEAEISSDSDDYQTIYSQKIEKTLKHRHRAHNLPKRKTHSKISYRQTYPRDRSPDKKRSPYMEQEYRRYWNEKLMFHDDRLKHSSENPYSDAPTPQRPYYRSYEARSALVEPKRPYIPESEPRRNRVNRENDTKPKLEPKLTSKGMAWLKKHKMGIHCGEQWKKLILEG